MTTTKETLVKVQTKVANIEKRLDEGDVKFDAMDSETPLNIMQRVALGWNSGIITLNQALDELNLPTIGRDGDMRKDEPSSGGNVGELPRENSQPGATDGN